MAMSVRTPATPVAVLALTLSAVLGAHGGCGTMRDTAGYASPGDASLPGDGGIADATIAPDADGSAPTGVRGALQGATTPDPTVVLAYPYDGTVFPRGPGPAPLMWMGAAPTDQYWVHLAGASYDFQSYFSAPSGRYDFDPAEWQRFTSSTAGAAELKLTRWNGTAATVVADQHWTVAPGSMRGTVYYWSVNAESVERLTGGATAPENFLNSSGPAENHAPYCPSCHTVSADGSHLVLNEGLWGNAPSPVQQSYTINLLTGATAGPFLPNPVSSQNACEQNGCPSEWGLAAVSPDGSIVVENFSNLRGQIGQQTGAFDSQTAQPIPNTGLEGHQLCMPAFSPDGLLLVYVDCAAMDLRAYDWDPVNRKAHNDRLLSASSQNTASAQIQYPTVSPDHQWAVYGRGPALGSAGTLGNLYAVSVANPGSEIALAALNGATYPFAAGDRDRNWNYEPTFAPVASGGYFWVVFHSRRTWGNAITQAAYTGESHGVKQLWVSAFDQSPRPGVDPSHSPFHLPGQETTATQPATGPALDPINSRGYWALSPCKGDGQSCQSGTDCCGGYCVGPDGGVCQATSGVCSHDGDRCRTVADCCSGTDLCINGYCAQPPNQ
jgi:hypothetical protein